MKSSLKKTPFVIGAVGCYLLLMILMIYMKHSRSDQVSQLETTVSQIRLGWTSKEVNQLLGSPPDTTSPIKGVILNSMTMTVTENLQKTIDGIPQEYVRSNWKRDDETASVVFDQEGKVVYRRAWSESRGRYHPYSPYQVFKRVGLF
ncbi:MAG: hypothetical protein KDA77_03765 [Planctomycetaceae bacterium]|nr:hypothetical protein [Planctomycetaceae bacterium]